MSGELAPGLRFGPAAPPAMLGQREPQPRYGAIDVHVASYGDRFRRPSDGANHGDGSVGVGDGTTPGIGGKSPGSYAPTDTARGHDATNVPGSRASPRSRFERPGRRRQQRPDGSVRFVRDSVNRVTWWGLGSRNGAEAIGSDAYGCIGPGR
jgi:hypothetical protein